MTYLAIISATLTAIFIGYMGYCIGHWDGYMQGYEKGTSDKQLGNYTYIIEDEPEFKEHELN